MATLALGNFDGVHIAHKAVLENAARQGDAVCLMFRTHPLEALTGSAPARLLSAEQAREKIAACGIRRCAYLAFEEVRELSPEEFFREVLLQRFHAECICCGYNYTFGKNKAGNVSLLQKLCEANGVKLIVADEVKYKGTPISSSRIRRCIAEGNIEAANAMLGYTFFYEGKVEAGKKLGRELGFPTINQYFEAGQVKPFAGVYASTVRVGARRYKGLTNIGDNPTVSTDSFRSETYLFDFEGDLYGETARVELRRFVRQEKKFESIEALRRQVLEDIERAKNV